MKMHTFSVKMHAFSRNKFSEIGLASSKGIFFERPNETKRHKNKDLLAKN